MSGAVSASTAEFGDVNFIAQNGCVTHRITDIATEGRKGEPMIKQGVDDYGAEYKRTSHDFSFKFLTQDNCVCNICHGTGAKWGFRYVTRNYQSPRTKKICKTLQAHEHSFWICPECLQNLTELTGVQVKAPERRTDENNNLHV